MIKHILFHNIRPMATNALWVVWVQYDNDLMTCKGNVKSIEYMILAHDVAIKIALFQCQRTGHVPSERCL